MRPLPVDERRYLAAVLALLPEELGATMRPDWGVSPRELARRTVAEVLARLAGQPPRAAHGWLVLGAGWLIDSREEVPVTPSRTSRSRWSPSCGTRRRPT